MSYKEIAVEFGVSWQRIWQIEQRALAKLRKELRLRGLTFLDLLPETNKEPLSGLSVHTLGGPTVRRAFLDESNHTEEDTSAQLLVLS